MRDGMAMIKCAVLLLHVAALLVLVPLLLQDDRVIARIARHLRGAVESQQEKLHQAFATNKHLEFALERVVMGSKAAAGRLRLVQEEGHRGKTRRLKAEQPRHDQTAGREQVQVPSVDEAEQSARLQAQSSIKECRKLFLGGLEPISRQANNTKAWRANQCNQLFCNGTTVEGLCQWSYFAIDTLLEETSNLCTSEHQEEFFPEDHWNQYRMSDYVNGIKQVALIPLHYPGSILAKAASHGYIASGTEQDKKDARRAVLDVVVAEQIAHTPVDQRPKPGTLVIHLRLGDVVDGAADSVRDLLMEEKYFFLQCHNETDANSHDNPACPPWQAPYNPPFEESWNKYVKPLSYYSSLSNLDDYKSVVIMGAAHLGRYSRVATKSCHYTEALRTYLQRRMPHATISLRVGHLPDDDILFAAQAARFIKSNGGFSRELERLNLQMKKTRFRKIISRDREAEPST